MQSSFTRIGTPIALSFAALAADAGSPRLQVAGAGQRVEPLAVAACRFAGGRLALLGDWMVPTATIRGPHFIYAYDCFESDTTDLATLVPTDDAGPGGCTSMLPAGQRWHFQFEYNNPFVSADLTTSIPGAGRMCEGVVHAWYWDVGSLEPDHDSDGRPDAHCFILFQTFENMDTLGCTDDGSNALDALIVDLGFRPTPSPGTFYYVALDLTSIAVTLSMPADGVGGYQIRYFIDVPPGGPPVPPPGHDVFQHRGVSAQPMLWGTGDAEPIPDNRAGYQNTGQFDDDFVSDGTHDLGLECYIYDFGVCPDPLGAATGFLYVAGAGDCPCPADLDGDGVISTGDLTILLTEFGHTCPCDNACVDINFSGVVDLADLSALLSAFGGTCP